MSAYEPLQRLLSEVQGDAPLASGPDPGWEVPVGQTVDYLQSDVAAAAFALDPYWPKWDGPWWHMRILWELGLAHRIPERALCGLRKSLQRNLCPSFPFDLDSVPPAYDKQRGTACHCQLGTMYEVLQACGVAMDLELPWARGWFLRYQLPDGGLNCDEAVYLRKSPHSSFLSTLPALEAMRAAGPLPLAPAEETFLARGAAYLLQRKFCRSLSKGGTVIDPAWLALTFPRFYHYDVLRGLAFVVLWAVARPLVTLRAADLVDAVAVLPSSGPVVIGRAAWAQEATLRRQPDATWAREARAARFALLDCVGVVGSESPALTQSRDRVVAGLRQLQAEGRIDWA